jgi:segregation and condensation protein B
MEAETALTLKQVLGAMVFGASQPLTVARMRQNLAEVAEAYGGDASAFAGLKDKQIEAALAELVADLEKAGFGVQLGQSAEGYRFHSDPACGSWLRHLRGEERSTRLSRPALETLAIIAYRQPVMRSEIEGVRGVGVDHVIRQLLEMQLIRIVGRSELPGRPLLYGTTGPFLEHFGLKNVKDLPGIEQLSRIDLERQRAKAPAPAPEPAAAEAGAPAPAESAPAPDAPAAEPTPEAAAAPSADGENA